MILILLFLIGTINAQVLVIGDSHTAGIYGKELHNNLSREFKSVATYGHSSSAAIHWISSREVYLTGGKFQRLSINRVQIKDPNLMHWRQKALVPYFYELLDNIIYQKNWSNKTPLRIYPSLVIIGLGANDARAIADKEGRINERQYSKRSHAIQDMIEAVHRVGAKCIWVGPPNGIKKSKKNQESLYKYLRNSVGRKCKFISSNHYKVTGCDGIHFNCQKLFPIAKRWAKEISNKIIQLSKGNK